MGGVPTLPGTVDSSIPTNPAYPTTSGPVTAFTDVTADLYYRNGSLGTLEIPSIGLSVNIYQGTDSAALKRARATSPTPASGAAMWPWLGTIEV